MKERIRILNNPVPPMVHPWGEGWEQPPATDMQFYKRRERTRVEMTHAMHLGLGSYDCSWPSGVYPGKMWRRNGYLYWYGDNCASQRALIVVVPVRAAA